MVKEKILRQIGEDKERISRIFNLLDTYGELEEEKLSAIGKEKIKGIIEKQSKCLDELENLVDEEERRIAPYIRKRKRAKKISKKDVEEYQRQIYRLIGQALENPQVKRILEKYLEGTQLTYEEVIKIYKDGEDIIKLTLLLYPDTELTEKEQEKYINTFFEILKSKEKTIKNIVRSAFGIYIAYLSLKISGMLQLAGFEVRGEEIENLVYNVGIPTSIELSMEAMIYFIREKKRKKLEKRMSRRKLILPEIEKGKPLSLKQYSKLLKRIKRWIRRERRKLIREIQFMDMPPSEYIYPQWPTQP